MRPRMLDCLPIPGDEPSTLFKDEHLWVVHKPQGWLTHTDGATSRPDLVSWCDEQVGVHHRLDVDTTGVIAFSRSKEGAQRLQAGFTDRSIRKVYYAVVAERPRAMNGEIKKPMPTPNRRSAHTRYSVKRSSDRCHLLEVEPVTGRTHQIRFHLAEIGCPIIGDARYGCAVDRRAPRTLLHCAELKLAGNAPWRSPLPADMVAYDAHSPSAVRDRLRRDPDTDCFREFNGAADGHPGWRVDRYGDWLWVQQDEGTSSGPLPEARGVYIIDGKRDRSHGGQDRMKLLSGEAAPMNLAVQEHGVRYRVILGDQLSTGLFLDQRPQRAWLAENTSGMRVLNTFAQGGGFSVAAACAGAETVSLDLSKEWLQRIPLQLTDHGISLEKHDQIFGDVFNWIPRLARRGERFDLVILDPPSTSIGTKKRRWSARKDYPELVQMAASLVAPGGALWTATNHRGIPPRRFARLVQRGLPEGYQFERVCPLAEDFPCIEEPHLKTFVWRAPK